MIGMHDGAGSTTFGIGEWATVAATLSYIASTLVAHKSLCTIPVGLFSVGRTIMGSVIYFVLACLIIDPHAFRDILAPELWSWIWLYTGIAIVLAQVAWNMALKYARAETLTLATSFSPLVAILIATALLGEALGPGFAPGAVLILFSILLSRRSADLEDIPEGGATRFEFVKRLRNTISLNGFKVLCQPNSIFVATRPP